MNNTFVHGATKATLHVELYDGSSYDIKFGDVRQFDMVTDCGYHNGFREWPSGVTAVKLIGRVESTVTSPVKKADVKPAPKPKKPSVKASADRVRKATVNHAKLTKKISAAEEALRVAKVAKEQLDRELKIAREQLLASATPEVR